MYKVSENKPDTDLPLGLICRESIGVLFDHLKRKRLPTAGFKSTPDQQPTCSGNSIYTLKDAVDACRYSIDQSGDHLFPMRAGRRMQLGRFPIIGALSMHAENIKQVLEDLSYFQKMTSKGELGFELEYDQTDAFIRITHNNAEIPGATYFYDLMFSGIAYATFRIAHSSTLKSLGQFASISLARPPYSAGEDIRALFYLPVHYHKPHYQIHFSTEFLMQPLPSANATIYESVRTVLDKTVTAWNNQGSLTERVDTYLKSCDRILDVSINEVARHFCMSASTLQRKLKVEGTSYRAIHQEAMFEKASSLLAQHSLSVQEVSQHLGYSEANSFFRFFKQFTGETPANYRMRN